MCRPGAGCLSLEQLYLGGTPASAAATTAVREALARPRAAV